MTANTVGLTFPIEEHAWELWCSETVREMVVEHVWENKWARNIFIRVAYETACNMIADKGYIEALDRARAHADNVDPLFRNFWRDVVTWVKCFEWMGGGS